MCMLTWFFTACLSDKWASSRETPFLPYVNNKGADQPAHLRSLINAFVVCCLNSIILLVSIHKISCLYLASVAEQASLSLTWSQTSKTGFLLTGLKYPFHLALFYNVPVRTKCLLDLRFYGPVNYTSVTPSLKEMKGKTGREEKAYSTINFENLIFHWMLKTLAFSAK